jgi:hypothetical protein
VAFAFYIDFFISGFILCNYDFIMERTNDDFLNYESVYAWIIFVQIVDIILNFFKMDNQDVKEYTDKNFSPSSVAKRYIKGTFVFDCIAVIPYATTKPGLIFLRYLKLIKIGAY